MILCDAPTRAFVTCTIGHNGFFACTKCEVEVTIIIIEWLF